MLSPADDMLTYCLGVADVLRAAPRIAGEDGRPRVVLQESQVSQILADLAHFRQHGIGAPPPKPQPQKASRKRSK